MKLAFFVVASAMLATSALASGPVVNHEAPVVAYVAPVTAYNWGGGYLGFGVSYARGGMSSGVAVPNFADTSGPGLSAIAGYNWQNGNLVYGAEAVLDFSRRRGTNDCGAGALFECTSYQTNHASIRGRVGVAMDRTLLFATLGYGTDLRRISSTSGGVPVFDQSNRHGGAVLGIGIEQAMSAQWTLRGDIEHYFLGTETYGGTAVSADTDLVRLSLVRRF